MRHFLVLKNKSGIIQMFFGPCEQSTELFQILVSLHCKNWCSKILLFLSIHGIFQARILEWVAISISRGSSQPTDQTQVSHIVGRCFTIWATREVLDLCIAIYKIKDLRDNLGIFQVIEHCRILQFLLLILYLSRIST